MLTGASCSESVSERSRAAGAALVASIFLTPGVGCGVEEEPAASPRYVEGATVLSGDADVVYVQDPPVSDIETYPSVMYDGGTVDYVGGQWYRHGPRGWGYYRHEPAELGRQRESRTGDAQWGAGALPRRRALRLFL